MRAHVPIRDRILARLAERGDRGSSRADLFAGMPWSAGCRELEDLVAGGLAEARHAPARYGRGSRRAATVYVAKGGGR